MADVIKKFSRRQYLTAITVIFIVRRQSCSTSFFRIVARNRSR